MATPKKIHVNSSSMIDLKAELFRKQEALKAEKLRRELGQFSKDSIPGLKEKKANAEKQNAGVQERAKKDVQEVVSEEDIDILKKSREVLEKKTRIYDTLTKAKILPDDEIKGLYLVDFERKILHNLKEQPFNEHKEKKTDIEEIPSSGPDEEWVDYVDALGRSRRCMRKDLPDLQEMDKELKNCRNSTSHESKDQENEISAADNIYQSEEAVDVSVGPIHYQNVRHNEIRTHGVGYFSFSTDEEQRKIQIDSLKSLRDQTVEQRAARQRLKEKRKAALKARLAKVKQRKGIEIESEDSHESESDKDNEVKKEENSTENECKKETKTRPWDIGKILPPVPKQQKFTQESWIEKKREERFQEFAPPQFYNLDATTFGDNCQSHVTFPSRNCIPDNENVQNVNMTTQDDIERIIAETVTYYKNKTK